MGLRDRLRRWQREAAEGAVVVHLRDGGTRYFEDMDVLAEMFLAKCELIRGKRYESEVLDAVRNATPESRAEFEERFGPITSSTGVIASAEQGGWAEVYELLEDGSISRTYHEGGSPEAERIRREAQQRGPSF